MENPTPPVESPPVSVPAVTDHRPVPRGVIPRGVQTWLLAGLALFMLAIMLVVGRPEPPARSPSAAAPTATATQSADRVRDYQDRLRAAESRALAEVQAATQTPTPAPSYFEQPQTPPPEDPIAADKRRREYESLFASNVVLSRRPDSDRPDTGGSGTPVAADVAGGTSAPTMDQIADAALRATARAGASLSAPQQPASPVVQAQPTAETNPGAQGNGRQVPERTGAISAAGPLHRILEGTVSRVPAIVVSGVLVTLKNGPFTLRREYQGPEYRA